MSRVIEFKNRLVDIVSIDGIDRADYPDMVDAYCNIAIYIDDGSSLHDLELDDLNDEHSDVIQQFAREELF